MTQPSAPDHAAPQTPLTTARPSAARASGAPRRTAAAALVALLLAACSSTPLPPWPTSGAAAPRPMAPAPVPRAQPAKVVPAPLGAAQPAPVPQSASQSAQRPGAVTAPLPPTAPVVGRNEPLATPATPPYGPAVMARFPEPTVRYSTPGLAPDRRAFTTNAEVEQWLQSVASGAAGGPSRASVLRLGNSQRGEPLLGLLLTRAPGDDPASLDAGKRPTVVLIGQQHGNEPAAAEALLVIARELGQGLLEPLLERINVIVVPRANPDGAQADTRATANGIDMNRDHLLLKTPEAQAIARLVRDYRPILVVDAHEYTVVGRYKEKFNAVQRYDALLQYTTTANYPEFLTKASQEWYHQPMVAALQAQGLSSEWYYTNATGADDRTLSMGGTQPDTGRNVHGLKNTVSLLIETRGVGIGALHMQRRVHTQVTAITSALRSTAERAANLEQVRSFVVRDISSKACRDNVVVEAGPTPTQRDVVFIDPETGMDRPTRVDWNSSLNLRTLKSRARPCGYWVSDRAAPVIERLKLLGLQVMRIGEGGSLLADTYRETAREESQRRDVLGTIGTSGDIVRVQVAPVRAAIDVPAGSYYVPLNQPLAHLAVAALEPDTQNSYFANRLLEDLSQTARVMSTPSLVFEETD